MFLWHQEVIISPQLSTYHPLGRISLANDLYLNDWESICTQMMMVKLSLPPR